MKWQCYLDTNMGWELVNEDFPNRMNRDDVTRAFEGRFGTKVINVNPSPTGWINPFKWYAPPKFPYSVSIDFFFMRKIERQMQRAIANKVNWSQSNTTVFNDNEGNTFVTLHGNLIATIFANNDIKLSSCGWETNTTKSRLNAILDTFLHGLSIFQKDFVWYIGDDKFFDGYTIHR